VSLTGGLLYALWLPSIYYAWNVRPEAFIMAATLLGGLLVILSLGAKGIRGAAVAAAAGAVLGVGARLRTDNSLPVLL
jgi:hypothetical protein